jgi:uncharacterized protein (TIGR00296 family)
MKNMKLSLEEGKILVKIARKAIIEYLEKGIIISPPSEVSENLLKKMGVFVTLNAIREYGKELRGCIGYPQPIFPLIEATIRSAISAATEDPRFPPVEIDEMENIIIEVSVLTVPQLIEVDDPREYPKKIKIGEDGLIVEKGFYRGLLLPQVAIEWNWDEEEFLCQTCIKAGLDPSSWLDKKVKIYKFQAQIFEEESPNGEIFERKIA